MLKVLIAWLTAALIASAALAQQPPAAAPPAARLPPIVSWGYQLQKPDPEAIAASPFDLVVIDYSRTGDEEGRFTREDVERMRKKPDGSRRVVLAYLSIGEAESYRYYWNDEWVEAARIVTGSLEAPVDGDEPARPHKGPRRRPAGAAERTQVLHLPRLSAPIWLGRENESWSGNYLVRYWEPGWQRIIFGEPKAYLDRILAAGFDGVYLDRVDVYYSAENRPSAKADMVAFVRALAAHARARQPGFIILPQNGEELLLEPDYLAIIDGVAKEDLLFGSTEGQPNAQAAIDRTLGWLAAARAQGVPVLVVEYVLNSAVVARARADLLQQGFVPYFADRALDRLYTPADIEALRLLPGKAAPKAVPPPAKAPKAPTAPRR